MTKFDRWHGDMMFFSVYSSYFEILQWSIELYSRYFWVSFYVLMNYNLAFCFWGLLDDSHLVANPLMLCSLITHQTCPPAFLTDSAVIKRLVLLDLPVFHFLVYLYTPFLREKVIVYFGKPTFFVISVGDFLYPGHYLLPLNGLFTYWQTPPECR